MDETIEIGGMTFKKVHVFGMIYTPFKRNYYLLSPVPDYQKNSDLVPNVSQSVVPAIPMTDPQFPMMELAHTDSNGKQKFIYSYARLVFLSCPYMIEARHSRENEGIWVLQLPPEYEQAISEDSFTSIALETEEEETDDD